MPGESIIGVVAAENLWRLLRKLPPLPLWRLAHRGGAEALAQALGRLLPRPPEPPWAWRRVFGIEFPSPVGVGAGVDKDGSLLWLVRSTGAGFHVVGSILPRPSRGVEPKILLRLPSGATLNRLGLPSPGLGRVLRNLSKRPRDIPVGGNIAGHRPRDYAVVYRAVEPFVDWVEVNISCPNVESHRGFEEPVEAAKICKVLPAERRKPVLLKIPPVLGRRLREYVELAESCGFQGLVVSNTLRVHLKALGVSAGLGGAPLYRYTVRAVREARSYAGRGMVIIGVGGALSPERILGLLRAGADLVEVVSGLFQKSPGLPWRASWSTSGEKAHSVRG